MENTHETQIELEPDQLQELEELQQVTGHDYESLARIAMEHGLKLIRQQIEEQHIPPAVE